MKRKKFFPLIFAIIILFSVSYGAISISHAILARNDRLNEIQQSKREVSKLKREIKELEDEISHSDSVEYVEKVAREDLGMVKPREVVYIDKDKTSK